METEMMKAMCMSGAYTALALSALGSSIATGVGGCAAVGAWKKCYAQNKPAPFLLLAYAGAPLSQAIYGFILLVIMKGKVFGNPAVLSQWPLFLTIGILGGLALALSSIYQGLAAAASCHAYAETDQGFANNLMILGVIETVSIFALVFALLALP